MSTPGQPFVEWLVRLSHDDRRAMAILRRSLAFEPGDFPAAFPYIEPFVPATTRGEHIREALYLLGGLFALHPEHASTHSIARELARVAAARNSGSIEQRFLTLLASDEATIAQRLRQLVTLVATDGAPIDYVELLADLYQWMDPYGHAARDRIRRRWARQFYSLNRENKDHPEASIATDRTNDMQ
jgi:CRISPR system Cascade subunit CasB